MQFLSGFILFLLPYFICELFNYMELIHLNQEKCAQCMQCVRDCPVRAIKLGWDQEYPEILHERCIGCGSCLRSCDYGAITYHDSIPAVQEMLASGQKVAAILDPSIAAEFPDITDYRKLAGLLRLLDFAWVAETAFAVEVIAQKYGKLLKEFKGKYYLTSNCPSLVLFVEKFEPQLTGNLAPMLSPMLAMAAIMREIYGQDIKVVGIVPCISAKIEASRSEGQSKVDEVITFTELRTLFKGMDISEASLEFSFFDPPNGRYGSLYPIDNGFVQIADINENILTGNTQTASGKHEFMQSVNEFARYPETVKSNFNIFYNKGCMMGPGMTFSSDYYRRHALVKDYASRRITAVDEKTWNEYLERFSKLDLSCSFITDDQRLPVPGEDKINEVLKIIGKENVEDDTSCNLCGFNTCRDFAIAVSQGLAKTDLCIPYSLKTKENYIKILKNPTERYGGTIQKIIDVTERITKGNYHSSGKLPDIVASETEATEMRNLAESLSTMCNTVGNREIKMTQKLTQAEHALQTLGVLIQKLPAGIVIVNENLRVVESNTSFVDMLGEDAAMINEVIPGLKNADLKTLLPFSFYNLFKYVLTTNTDVLGKDLHFEDKMLNISIYSIVKNKVVGAVIRDMYLPEVQKEELVKRLTEVIDQNLQMVQEIGFLLGEGASNTERMLNSLIETHRAHQKKIEQ